MQKLILILQLYPLIMKMVETNEAAVPGAGQGAAKLGLILQSIAAVFAASPELQKVFPLAELQSLVTKIVETIVAVKNITGAFQKATPAIAVSA